jgi:hypothetical protein
MERISSRKTFFYKKIIPKILLIHISVVVSWVVFFDYKFSDLFFPIGVAIIFGFGWLFSFRQLKEVYLVSKHLEVDGEKIFFENIISIEKTHLYYYKVTYKLNGNLKSFMFMPIVPLITPESVKEIREFIKKNGQKNKLE